MQWEGELSSKYRFSRNAFASLDNPERESGPRSDSLTHNSSHLQTQSMAPFIFRTLGLRCRWKREVTQSRGDNGFRLGAFLWLKSIGLGNGVIDLYNLVTAQVVP